MGAFQNQFRGRRISVPDGGSAGSRRHSNTRSDTRHEIVSRPSFWLLRRQYPKDVPRELHHLLFVRTRVDPQLSAARQQLYATATDYAARFCTVLQSALFSNRLAQRGAIAALRRFYRLSSSGKLRYIDGLRTLTAES